MVIPHLPFKGRFQPFPFGSILFHCCSRLGCPSLCYPIDFVLTRIPSHVEQNPVPPMFIPQSCTAALASHAPHAPQMQVVLAAGSMQRRSLRHLIPSGEQVHKCLFATYIRKPLVISSDEPIFCYAGPAYIFSTDIFSPQSISLHKNILSKVSIMTPGPLQLLLFLYGSLLSDHC